MLELKNLKLKGRVYMQKAKHQKTKDQITTKSHIIDKENE